MKVWMGTMTCTALMVGMVRAEPFQIADISADAAWIVHLDVAGLKDTRVGDMLLEEMNRKESAAKLDALKAVFNFDPRQDLSGATLYGTDARPERSVAVLRGRFDTERLVTLVRANPTYEKSRAGSHDVHSWIDENKPGAKRVFAGFDGERTLVIGESNTRVAVALEVLDGAAESLDPSSSVASTIQGTRASLFVAAANMADLPDVAPQAALLKKARAFQLALAAPGDDLEGTLRLTTDTARTAQFVEQILRGMVAFAKLNDAGQPEVADMARAIRITRDGSRVECAMSHPLDDVIIFLQNEVQRKRMEKGS